MCLATSFLDFVEIMTLFIVIVCIYFVNIHNEHSFKSLVILLKQHTWL